MKKQRFAKIAVLILAAVLLIGAVVGISVSAEGETTVAVAAKNISYEGAVQVVYYVDAQNFDSEAQTLKMDFWIAEKGETPSYTKTFENDANKVEINGKIYYAFFSNGIAPIDMTKPVYAQPYVVAEGEEVVRGDVSAYSVYTYAMNRFSQQPTEDQLTLYKALLDYGAAVQTIFPDDANTDIYGWADAYYDITENVYVDGTLDADASVTGAKRPAELAEVGKLVDGKYVIAYAGEMLGGAFYKNIIDASGNRVNNPYSNPGTHSYNINYTTTGRLNTFEGYTSANPIFNGGSYTSGGNYANGDIYGCIDNTEEYAYVAVADGTGKDGNASTYIVTGTHNTKKGAYKIDLNDGTNVPAGVGVTYVVDFDFKVGENFSYSGSEYKVMAYIGLNGVAADFTGTGGRGANFADFYLFSTAAGDYQTLNFANTTAMAMDKHEWYDIRVEYEILSMDNLATEANEANAEVRLYKNSVLCYTFNSTIIANLETLFIGLQDTAETHEYFIDNLYVGTFAAENVKGTGLYHTGAESTDYNVSYNFDDVTDISTLISKYAGTTLNNVNANHYTAVENGEFVTGTSDVIADSSVGAGSWGWFALQGPDNTNNDGEVGTKYVLEMDFKYNGGTGRTSDKRLAYSFGMNSLAQPASSGTSFAAYTLYDGGDGKLNFGSATAPAFQLDSGIWYNVRFEYVVTANGYKVNGSTVWTGILNVYVDGSLVATKNTSSQEPDINKAFNSFYFEHNGVDASYAMDNIYMGIVNDSASKGTGVYYNQYLDGTLTGATVWDFDGEGETITTGNQIISADHNLNNHKPDGASYADRHILITGSGAMKAGVDNVESWSKAYFNGKDIPVAVGETAIFETDFMFGGSDVQSDYIGELHVINSDNGSISNMRIYNGLSKDGTTARLWANNAYSVEIVKNTWHVVTVKFTRTETGANVEYYLDGVQFATAARTVEASVVHGIYWVNRPGGATHQSFFFDNMIFDNIDQNPVESSYNSYYEAFQGGAVEYNGNVLDADSTLAWGFDESITLEKGTDKFMGLDTTADLNVNRDRSTGPYVNVSDGTLNFGLNHTVDVSGTIGEYDSNSYRVDKNVGLTGAVGKTYVIEYDFTFNGGTWDTDASGKKHDIMAARLIVSGGNVTTLFTGYRSADSEGNLTGLTIDCNNGGKQTQKLAVGTTYNLRFEIDITGESAATVNMYIDDVLYHSWNITRSGITSFVGVSNLLVLTANQDYAIDNFIATVIDTPAD